MDFLIEFSIFRYELAEECADDDEDKSAIRKLRKRVKDKLKNYEAIVHVRFLISIPTLLFCIIFYFLCFFFCSSKLSSIEVLSFTLKDFKVIITLSHVRISFCLLQ